jgi:hypothetical protein
MIDFNFKFTRIETTHYYITTELQKEELKTKFLDWLEDENSGVTDGFKIYTQEYIIKDYWSLKEEN